MARNFRDLPGRQVGIDVLGELLAFLAELVDLIGDIHRAFGLHIAQFLDFAFEFGNRVFEIQECFFRQDGSPLVFQISIALGTRSP